MKGTVYVLSNENYKKGVYKIGLTTKPIEDRMKQLKSTGVIGSFKCEYKIDTDDCHRLEKLAHIEFQNERIDKKREFFEVNLYKIIKFLQETELKNIAVQQQLLNNRAMEILGLKAINEIEEIKEDKPTRELVEVFLGYKNSNVKGLLDVENKSITILKGSKIILTERKDFLGKTKNSVQRLSSLMNEQINLINSNLLDSEGNIINDIKLSVDKSGKIATGKTSIHSWKIWKTKDNKSIIEFK